MLKYHFIKKHFLPGLSCDFQVQVEKGNPFVIYGENGIGKSSFLRMFFDEKEIQYSKVLIPQKITPPFFDRKVRVVKKIIQNLPGINLNRFNDFWSEFNFELKEELFLSVLSGGERQILQIISLLSREADVYLLDEPSVGLDEKNKKILLKLISEISHGKFIIIVEHERSWIPLNWNITEITKTQTTLRFSS